MNKSVDRILRTHPRVDLVAVEETNGATDALLACVEACTICADACLFETNVSMLRRCIRTNQDCGDICTVTLRIIARQTESVAEIVRQQVHSCLVACQLCAEECSRHDHRHCKLCAEACRRCQEACNRLLGQISSSGTIPADPLESPSLTV
jgi:hypothetical protein